MPGDDIGGSLVTITTFKPALAGARPDPRRALAVESNGNMCDSRGVLPVDRSFLQHRPWICQSRALIRDSSMVRCGRGIRPILYSYCSGFNPGKKITGGRKKGGGFPAEILSLLVQLLNLILTYCQTGLRQNLRDKSQTYDDVRRPIGKGHPPWNPEQVDGVAAVIKPAEYEKSSLLLTDEWRKH